MDAKLTWLKLLCHKTTDLAMKVELEAFPFIVSKAGLRTNRLSFRYPFPTKTPLREITILWSPTIGVNLALLIGISETKFIRRKDTYNTLFKDSNLPEINLRRIFYLPITLAVVEFLI